MKKQVKKDYIWFACYVEGLLEELEKGWIDDERFVKALKSKHEELKSEDFSKVIDVEY